MPTRTLPQLIDQVDRIERQVRAISDHLGIPYETPLTYASDSSEPTEVEELVREGKKVEAVRLHHELTGLGLKEAKEAVEELERS